MFSKVDNRRLVRSYSEIGCGDIGRTNKPFRRDIIDQVKKIQSRHQIRRPACSLSNQTTKGIFARSLEKKLCSKSMTDLLGNKSDEEEVGSRSQRFYPAPKSEVISNQADLESSEICQRLNKTKTMEAGRRILTVLMLNAWRRQREDNKEAKEDVKNLTSQIESFEMQLYVLRQLLETEKARVAATNDEIHKALTDLQDCKDEKSNVIKENSELQSRVNELEERIVQLENKCANQRNDLITTKAEAENWEKQLEKEREKLKKAEEEKRALREEVQFRVDIIACQQKSLEQLSQNNMELQNNLEFQINIAQEQIKLSEEMKAQQEKTIIEKDEEIRKLKINMSELVQRLLEENEKNGELGKSILEKSEELKRIQEKLGELSNCHISWGGRVIKIASICAKVPFACFYTLAILLLPIPTCERRILGF